MIEKTVRISEDDLQHLQWFADMPSWVWDDIEVKLHLTECNIEPFPANWSRLKCILNQLRDA